MANEVFKFYKENLGSYNLIFVNLKGWYYGLISAFIAGIIVVIISLSFNKPLGILASLIPFGILYLILNKKTKYFVREKYGVESTKFMWNSIDVLNKIKENEKHKLKEQLYLMDDEIEIKKITEELLNESIQRKFKLPIIPSLFALLLLPVWSTFVEWLFRYQNIDNYNDAVSLFLLLGSLITIVAGVLILIKIVATDLFDIFANKDSKKMKILSEMLNEILYDIERENRKSMKRQNVERGDFI